MTERTESFAVDPGGWIEVRLPAASVRVEPGDDDRVEVTIDGPQPEVEHVLVEARGNTVAIEPAAGVRLRRWLDVRITAGPSAALDLGLKRGEVVVTGPIRELATQIGAGDVRAGVIGGDVRLRTAAGDVSIERVAGRAELKTASGDIRVQAAGDIGAVSAAGDVHLGVVRGRASVKTAAGDVTVRCLEGDRCDVKCLSGDVRLGMPAGRSVDVDFKTLSGRIQNRTTPTEGPRTGSLSLTVKTTSGDIVLIPAEC